LKFKIFKNNLFIFLILLVIYPLKVFSDELIQKQDSDYTLTTEYLKKLPNEEYIISTGDILFIRISRYLPELNTLVTVNGEGTVYLPKLKQVYVKGLTKSELNKILGEAYQEFIKYPSIETEVTFYRSIKITVNGEVAKPGIFNLKGSYSNIETQKSNQVILNSLAKNPISVKQNLRSKNNDFKNLNSDLEFSNDTYQNELSKFSINRDGYYFPTVFDAIRSAGGITEYSDLSKVELIRKETLSNGGGRKITSLDFSKISQNNLETQNIRIYDGDIINIFRLKKPNYKNLSESLRNSLNPNYIQIIVSGRVKEPGKVVLPIKSTLNQAVFVAGGPKVIRGKIKFVRFNSNGTIEKRKIKFSPKAKPGSPKNPILKNNDLIFVDDSFLSATNEVIKEVSEPFTGIFSMYGLIKALD